MKTRILLLICTLSIGFSSITNSKQLEIRVMDEYAIPIEDAKFFVLDKSKNHRVQQEIKIQDGSFHLQIDYDKEYYFMIQSPSFYVTHLFLSFHSIKNQSLEGDVLSTQNTNIRILSKNTIGVTLQKKKYFQFLAKDQKTGDFIEAEYAFRLNKTGAVYVRNARKGEPIEFLPEMFSTFEVSVRKEDYITSTEEFLFDKSFKGVEHTFEMKKDSSKLISMKTVGGLTFESTSAKPTIPKINQATPQLIISFDQGSFYLSTRAQEQLQALFGQIQNQANTTIRIVGSHDGVGAAKINHYLAAMRATVIQLFLENQSQKGLTIVVQTIQSAEKDIPLEARRVAKIYLEHPQAHLTKK